MDSMPLLTAVVTCQKATTASAITGAVILAALLGGALAMAIANFHARSRLAIANAELARLRPENFRLQQWQASASGVPVHETYSSAYTTAPRAYTTDPGTYAAAPSASATDSAVQARWHPDPSGRHQLRYWDGSIWSDQVADNGVTSTDPAVD